MNLHWIKSVGKWVYDIRKLAKESDYGWTYFDYAGGFRAFEGQLFGFDHSNLFKTSPPPDAMVPRFNQALFGGTRP